MGSDFFVIDTVLRERVFGLPDGSPLKVVFIVETSEKVIRSFLPHIDPSLIKVLFYKRGRLIIQVPHNTVAHELKMKEYQIRLRFPAEFQIFEFRYKISS